MPQTSLSYPQTIKTFHTTLSNKKTPLSAASFKQMEIRTDSYMIDHPTVPVISLPFVQLATITVNSTVFENNRPQSTGPCSFAPQDFPCFAKYANLMLILP